MNIAASGEVLARLVCSTNHYLNEYSLKLSSTGADFYDCSIKIVTVLLESIDLFTTVFLETDPFSYLCETIRIR